MAENPRRCALPGCDATIEDAAGRPARRYCTAAHRSAARQARRASMQSGAEEQLSATLPWLREPDADPRDASPAARPVETPVMPQPAGLRNRAERRRAACRSETPPGRRTPGLHSPVPRRRRALAVLGAAGILVGGYAFTASQPLESPATTAVASDEDWAREARVALASVNRQLDTIAEVEAEWDRLPAERRAAGPTAPVEALAERRELLENRRATLRSQLESFEQLDGVRAELVESEQNLASIEATLAAAPPESQRTREQAAALAALAEQRDLRIRQRDAHRDELAALEGGVEDATARPLPDDVQLTEQVGEQVRQVIRGEDVPGPAPAEPLPPRPDVTSGRDEQEGSPRQDVDTSGPPDPRGPGDDTVDVPPPTDPPPAAPADPQGPPAADEGPVDQLAEGLDDAVDTVVGGADARDGDRDRAADRPTDPGPPDAAPGPRPADPPPADPPPAEDSGPVETVVDTVEDIADGPGRDDESPARPADRNREAERPAAADEGHADERSVDEEAADEGPTDEGPVENVLDTVGDVVDGPDQPADDARKRDRDKGERDRSDAERSAGSEQPAPADAPDTAVAPGFDPADDDVASPREVTPRFDDRYPDAPADLRAAPTPRAAFPAGDAVRADDARAAETALAVAAVRSIPVVAWTAPLVEEAARQQAAEPPDGSEASAPANPGARPSAPAPAASVEEEVAAAVLAMWGFDDDDIDALNEMAADAGYAERIPTPDDRTGTAGATGGEEAASRSEEATDGTPSPSSSAGEDAGGDTSRDSRSGYGSDPDDPTGTSVGEGSASEGSDESDATVGDAGPGTSGPGTSGDDGSGGDGSGGDVSGDGASGDGASGDGASGDGASGDDASGDDGSGDDASGDDGSGGDVFGSGDPGDGDPAGDGTSSVDSVDGSAGGGSADRESADRESADWDAADEDVLDEAAGGGAATDEDVGGEGVADEGVGGERLAVADVGGEDAAGGVAADESAADEDVADADVLDQDVAAEDVAAEDSTGEASADGSDDAASGADTEG